MLLCLALAWHVRQNHHLVWALSAFPLHTWWKSTAPVLCSKSLKGNHVGQDQMIPLSSVVSSNGQVLPLISKEIWIIYMLSFWNWFCKVLVWVLWQSVFFFFHFTQITVLFAIAIKIGVSFISNVNRMNYVRVLNIVYVCKINCLETNFQSLMWWNHLFLRMFHRILESRFKQMIVIRSGTQSKTQQGCLCSSVAHQACDSYLKEGHFSFVQTMPLQTFWKWLHISNHLQRHGMQRRQS